MLEISFLVTAWLKALLPKSALTVEEKAWNSYPYTKTRYTCPFIEKFSIEIETKYFNDCGNQPNVFNLSNMEINRQIGMENSRPFVSTYWNRFV